MLPVRLVTPKLLIVNDADGPLDVKLLMLIPPPAVGVTLVITRLPWSVMLPVLVTELNVTSLVVATA